MPVLLAHARAGGGYAAQRGDLTAKACVRLTQKFFSLPGVPPIIYHKKRRAISNAYIRGMDYAWADGCHWSTIISFTIHAILVDPSNASRAVKSIRHYAEQDAPRKVGLRYLLSAFAVLNAPRHTWHEVQSIWQPVHSINQSTSVPATRNLLGDRDIEWSWVAAQMPLGPGEALDFGPGGSHLGLIAAQRGFSVTAIDLGSVDWYYFHPQLRFVQGDILKVSQPESHFDLVINCSTVEHVGLIGRYGVSESSSDGDLKAMARLKDLMKPGGVMILTIPVGKDALFPPLTRVYGVQRLPRLLEGYVIEKEAYWVKDEQNRWTLRDKEVALNFQASSSSWDALQNVYALGCFVLRRPERDE